MVVDMVSELMCQHRECLPILALHDRKLLRGEVEPADRLQEFRIIKNVRTPIENGRLAIVHLWTGNNDETIHRPDLSKHFRDQIIHILLRHEVPAGWTNIDIAVAAPEKTRPCLVLCSCAAAMQDEECQ